MFPQIAPWSGPIDCTCGAPADARVAFATVEPAGTYIECACCHFVLWQGVVLYGGDDPDAAEVIRRVQAAAPRIAAADAYLEPWERRHALWLAAAPAENARDASDDAAMALNEGDA